MLPSTKTTSVSSAVQRPRNVRQKFRQRRIGKIVHRAARSKQPCVRRGRVVMDSGKPCRGALHFGTSGSTYRRDAKLSAHRLLKGHHGKEIGRASCRERGKN